MSFEQIRDKWARDKVIEMTKSPYEETCVNPTIISVGFFDGDGATQIGDCTWDYDEDSVIIDYIDDNGNERSLYYESKFSEILEELLAY